MVLDLRLSKDCGCREASLLFFVRFRQKRTKKLAANTLYGWQLEDIILRSSYGGRHIKHSKMARQKQAQNVRLLRLVENLVDEFLPKVGILG